jgi:acetylornithine/N-succinyldiaminopimelate aminotransferase
MDSVIWYPDHELLLPDIVRAENCHLHDSRGGKYLDLESGVWCTSIGHGHPRIREVIAQQAARLMHTGFCYASEIVEEAAQAVLGLLGFNGGKCVFLCSGSEAVEYGVRTAQAISRRPLLLTMADSYFGAYGSASRKQADEWFCLDWTACTACRSSDRCDDRCALWAEIPFADLGGFLFEPGSSAGLVRFPPAKLIKDLVARIKQDDGLVIVNEVTTGVGRTGTWFGYQHYGITPDIVALGKGIGNGYPVSVAALAHGITASMADRPLRYAQSHQNDPLGAAVAHEVVRVIEQERLIERGHEVAAALLAGLRGVMARTGLLKEIRARGLLIALELHDDPDASLTIRTHRQLVRRGYVLGRRPGVPVLRLDPALTVDLGDIQGFLAAFEAVLNEVPRDGQRCDLS